MRVLSLLTAAVSAALVAANPLPRQASNFAGYLISTFSDANPKVQFHLSNGNSASSFKFLNKGQPVLASTVGTRAVRDVFLTTNPSRSEWYLIATGKLRITGANVVDKRAGQTSDLDTLTNSLHAAR
ncbi:glycoside hydrolase family 43 (arabinosidase) [Colletotrichum musicola]|uniref:Glycoside hydrolase family 43 (Arabinosidase) n=1 Tax=Colletotrichum musicola TaxID=2175873 RepID=A0A8H6MID0_9PEZI|nr:glycoside hydrolase family 43 (arabinosidase) [Colletotrichum musicola]